MRRFATLACMISILMTAVQLATQSQKSVDDGPPSILEPGKGWELLGGGFQLTADSAVDDVGNVYFTDARRNRIWKVDASGKIATWKEDSGGTHGIAMGPDGRLYAGQHDRKRIVVYAPGGQETILTEDVQTHHLPVTERSEVYFADGPNSRIWLVDVAGRKRVVSSEMTWPHGMRVSTDRSSLIVTDSRDGTVWSFRIQTDGALTNGAPFFRLQISGERSEIDPGGVTVDTEGYVYIATKIGVHTGGLRDAFTLLGWAPPSESAGDRKGSSATRGCSRPWATCCGGRKTSMMCALAWRGSTQMYSRTASPTFTLRTPSRRLRQAPPQRRRLLRRQRASL